MNKKNNNTNNCNTQAFMMAISFANIFLHHWLFSH